jgi:NADPH:quinone reductase
MPDGSRREPLTTATVRPGANPIAGVEATCLRLEAQAHDVESIAPRVEVRRLFRERPEEVLIEIHAAAVNPSDVKAAIGMMPYAVFPRTPGRDFAGVVIDGPPSLLGKAVFGSSGDLGIRRDGTHASHLIVEAEALVEKPVGISVEEASGIGVPFVTAHEGFRRAGMPKPGETVLIMGLNGKVGQAATQIVTWRGARVIGVVRKSEGYAGHANGPVEVIGSSAADIPAKVKELTGERGAGLVYNTVGDPYYPAATASMAKLVRQIFIAAVHRTIEFNIFAFYRGRHTYVGVDTLALSSIETADVLRELAPGFASGDLKPFPTAPGAIYPLDRAAEAYQAVLSSARDRLVLRPSR